MEILIWIIFPYRSQRDLVTYLSATHRSYCLGIRHKLCKQQKVEGSHLNWDRICWRWTWMFITNTFLDRRVSSFLRNSWLWHRFHSKRHIGLVIDRPQTDTLAVHLERTNEAASATHWIGFLHNSLVIHGESHLKLLIQWCDEQLSRPTVLICEKCLPWWAHLISPISFVFPDFNLGGYQPHVKLLHILTHPKPPPDSQAKL